MIKNTLKMIKNTLTVEELKRITFIAFGSPFIYDDLHKLIEVEYFSNKFDPVTKLNLLKRKNINPVSVYSRESEGHFLVNDYLVPLRKGEFGTENKLYGKIK